MKFKIGDKVKVVKNVKGDIEEFAGKKGKVTDVTQGDQYPYDVKLSNGKMESFTARELEAA